MMRPRAGAAGAAATLAAAHLVPSVAAIRPLRVRALPGLSGTSPGNHVALTFDDGPDPVSTPGVLDTLDDLELRATFFVLGQRVATEPQLTRHLVERGHEVAVHGWTHRPHLLRTPREIRDDVRRAHEVITSVTGRRPAFWRPPHGIPTGVGLATAARLGLRPVLWTADGRDWSRSATPATVADRIAGQLTGGGVVLLHDSDRYSTDGTWRRARAALPDVVDRCTARGLRLGPLREHGLGRAGAGS